MLEIQNVPLPVVSREFVEMTKAAFANVDPRVCPERTLGQQDVIAFLENRFRSQLRFGAPASKELSPRKCFNPVIGEICDDKGEWVTGWLTFGRLADTIGTTTADLVRRLSLLGVLVYRDGRHRLTQTAIRKWYGKVIRKRIKGGPDVRVDVILPEGMVLLVRNLEATNAPETEAELLKRRGLSLSKIALQLGCSKQAVHKRLKESPPRLTNWKVSGSWADRREVDNGEISSTNQCPRFDDVKAPKAQKCGV